MKNDSTYSVRGDDRDVYVNAGVSGVGIFFVGGLIAVIGKNVMDAADKPVARNVTLEPIHGLGSGSAEGMRVSWRF